ncbi:MAG: GNAT family N-acetyltransferase [Clostridium sp.]|nr:GNAT family N-acetyltransferase [Clostridium sp.]
MGKINFVNYSKGERFGDNYKLLSEFFERYTGEGMQENWHIGRLDWMLNHDYTNPELLHSIGVWKEDNEVVGTVIFDVEHPPVYFLCKPGYEHLYNDMYEYAKDTFKTDKWCEKGNWIKTVIKDEQKVLAEFLKDKGFVFDGWPEDILELKCDANNKYNYSLPEGFSVTTFKNEKNYDKYAELLYKGFDHEGEESADVTYESVPFREPHWNDDLKILVKSPEGEWAAHCGMWYVPGTTTAYIEPVLTIPKYRKKGLAKAAIYEAINRCADLGAKRVIVISDMDFYYSIGFKKSSHYYHMAKYL